MQQPGVWPTNPTLASGESQSMLFSRNERPFIQGFADDEYVYLYVTAPGHIGVLRDALVTGAEIIRKSWSRRRACSPRFRPNNRSS